MKDKIMNIEKLEGVLQKERKKGIKIVFTNGCFDILHVGHVRYLAEARNHGDLLVVGLNSDDSVRKLKGSKRPLVTEEERAELLSYLEMVDFIVVFEELTAEKVILTLRPDIYIKGGDYKVEELPEAKAVKDIGGKIALIPEIEGASTTNIVGKIIERYEK